MSEKNIVEFIEEWQTGALLIVSSVVVGAILMVGVGSMLSSSLLTRLSAFAGGVLLTFLAVSYIVYGR